MVRRQDSPRRHYVLAYATADAEKPPEKTAALPETTSAFKKAHVDRLLPYGDKYCASMSRLQKEFDEMKHKLAPKVVEQIEGALMLSSALCGEHDKYLGYTDKDGLTTDTERFLANESTLKQVYIQGMNAAGAMMSAERLLLNNGLQLLNRDLTLFFGPLIQKVDEELNSTAENRKATADFNTWVKSLSKWYQTHPRNSENSENL